MSVHLGRIHYEEASRKSLSALAPFPGVSSAVGIHAYHQHKLAARKLSSSVPQEDRLAFTRAFCAHALSAYWRELDAKIGGELWAIQPAPSEQGIRDPGQMFLTTDHLALAQNTGVLIATFPVEDAGYLMGSLYTVMLPESMRSEMGAYYTPPPLVSRLMDDAMQAGTDFTTCSVIDPACGGGAFLAPVALRMASMSPFDAPRALIEDISSRLQGIELDSFAGWMTEVLLEATLLPLCKAAGMRFPRVVTIGDALDHHEIGRFDLVIGNPPYGRVRLDEARRARYARSLFGHANLYGLFTDLALRLVKDDGVIAYLTPTSFLGGQYFKSLRKLIAEQASPVAFDFVADRNGVFDDVLQETILVSYRMDRNVSPASVSLIVPQGLEAARVEPVGSAKVPDTGAPWIIARNAEDADYVNRLRAMPTRLADLGYAISTGQLVWNRHKAQFRTSFEEGARPVIWAESVSAAGFCFSAERRSHAPFIKFEGGEHLVTRKSCVLLQRTTAKEQGRRLISAVIPQSFIDVHDGVVVENHLNIIYACGKARVSPKTIACLLNAEAVDRAFRCISGSVAVSAYELEALPLPSVERVRKLDRFIKSGADDASIQNLIDSFYEN